MRRRQSGNHKGKAVYIIGGLALCSIIGMLGLYAYQINQKSKNPNVVDLNQMAEATEKNKTDSGSDKSNDSDDAKSTNKEFTLSNDQTDKQEKKDETKENSDASASSDMDIPESTDPAETAPEQTDQPVAEPEAQETSAVANSVTFSEGETLMWPVSGNVLMNYSMDGTIYFATLDQYKYNPAIIIQSNVNTNVLSATDGIVESITTNEETGLTMTVNLGNGYKAIYGQLKENQVSEGDYVEKGTILGFVNEPTKYYSTEGTNLYFKLTRDDQPINPVDYLE